LTNPSITYGHKYLDDCDCSDPTTFYTENRLNMLAGDATPTILYGDVLQIEAVFDEGATDEYCNYEKDITNFSSNTYPYFIVRWKTSESANGAKAKVILGFTSGTQVILDESYSTTWKVASGTITADKTIDKVFFYAEDDGTNGTFYVYYDFILLHKGTFTFPNVGHGMEFTPPPRYAIVPIFGRVGDITQGGGSELATVTCSCDLDIGRLSTTAASCTGSDWKRPQGVDVEYKTDYVRGEALIDIAHNTYHEPWQWLDTGTEQFKATLETPVFRRTTSGNKTQHSLDLLFREYRLSDASNESYVERFGLNL